MLAAQAADHLDSFGATAATLRDLVSYVVQRRN